MGLVFWAATFTVTARAQDKNVTEEILDILKEKGQITGEQYDELRKKAKEEREKQAGKDSEFEVYWKNGIRLDSRDEQFKIKIGGRIQVDWATLNADNDIDESFPDIEGSGVEFRRARLYVSGTIYDAIEFKAQYDFAGGDSDFRDVWISLKKIPIVGSIKAGHMKEPFSLEELTSSKYLTFLERALPIVFAPSWNTGLMIHNSALNKRMTWAVGVFEDTDDFGDSFNDFNDYNLAARMTGLPWYADGGTKLLHLGLSYSHQFRDEDDTTIRYRARPECHITDERLVDTGSIAVDDLDVINPELALVYGPLSLQAEYFHSFLDSDSADDPDFNGYYLFATYFLTGEHRNYKTSGGTFDRVKPKKNFSPTKGGWGAWEIGLRYSFLDLNDEGIKGGEEDNVTACLNWYLNPNTRLMLNYVHADLEDRAGVNDGDVNIFQARFQVDF
jgi:phosphate-selective porin OprO/OprP